jgi:16S rRNA (cytosine1402-N4)-methyltransferase
MTLIGVFFCNNMPDDSKNAHIPVLLEPIVEIIKNNSKSEVKIFDGTLGGGGYTQRFLELGYIVHAGDLDTDAIESFRTKNKDLYKDKLFLENGNFADLIGNFDDGYFDIIVLDLGFSSNQLEYSDRGFSYQKDDELLDLRYDPHSGLPCYKKLQKLKKPDDLWTVIYTNSGESMSRPIAKAVFDYVQLQNKPIYSVAEIREVIIQSIPKKFIKHKNAILSRVWQALRIWTNHEFDSLEKFLNITYKKLAIGGLLCIVSFHSLEDKIVTKFMRNLSKPIELDGYGNKAQYYKLLTPKPILPTEQEIEQNPRSRSAMLRVLKRCV